MSDQANDRRAGDPQDLNPQPLRREPVSITMDSTALAAAIAVGRRRAFKVGLITAVLTSIVVNAIGGLIQIRIVTGTVRDDVGRAAITNCTNTKAASTALSAFLTSDAKFNRALAGRDTRQARIDADLAKRIATLTPVPPTIAKDYAAEGANYQQLHNLRAQVSDLWIGVPARRGHPASPSLNRDVVVAVHANCDDLLTP